MADNIKIVGNILNTTTVSRYSSEDTNLISSRILQENFGETGDYIEVYLYDAGGNLLNINYDYLSYKLPSDANLKPGTTTQPNTTGNIQTTNIGVISTLSNPTSSLYPIIEIDPVMDIQNYGYSSGEFNIRYNLFKNKISNNTDQALFIKEISADRTEIRLASTTLTNDEIESVVNSIIDEINNSDYYVDYLLNFGNNEQYIAVNVALNKATTGYEVLFKLYQPLPLSVQEKTSLWIVEEKVNPYIFDINLDKLITPPPPPTLRGPNFDIPIENQGTIATAYGTYSNLISSLQNKSYYQVLNLMATQSANVNVDYTDFNNFVFFGSAKQRVINFHVKAKQIEDYNTLISTYTPQTASIPSLITEINQYSSNIKDITTQFDGYEYYLYFESSSYTWPKSGSLKPYSLLSTTNSTVTAWYNNLILVAENYDQNNYDNLEFAIPPFLTEDDTNAPFLLFLNMIGNYFDDIWIYIKSITDLNLANNNLDYGISKDLVYERLKSLGIKLYNSQAGESVSQYLIGANTGSSIFDNNFTITGSYLNNIPRKDLTSELYKRIYHNLPLLVKTKGTVAGLEHLNTIFGITSSILNVKEFGGSTKAELINGYNNDKVRIVQNTITGSVLSSMLSLQTFPTASSAFRDNDTHYIDISFSPQTQIDTYISESISISNPTWSLDDYIGDPRQQYNNSYSDLNNQRILYYQTGNTGSLSFNSGSALFNGTNSSIQVTPSTGISFGTSDYTIEAWVYFLDPNNSDPIIGTNNAGSDLSFYRENNSLFIDSFNDNTNEYKFPSITIGSWHHVAASRSGSAETVWLDGVRSTSGILLGNFNFSGITNYVGSAPAFPWNFNGLLTNVKAIKGSYLYNPASSSISIPTSLFTTTIINSTTWQLPLISSSLAPGVNSINNVLFSLYNPFTQAYPGFTGSLMDYNGFIRLIDYFDNSLFKMLADFTPERTSLSTGVTINSPVLERNKTSFANPTNSTTQSIYTAQFNTASITPQYSPLYNNLTGDKKPYFTGELSGSVVDVHQYFTDNYNQYLGDWDVYNSQRTISQSINLNSFNHSDWNVLLNNVSKNVTSNKRKGIQYIYGTTGSITSSVELQDSNLSLRSYQISRYEGSKVTSATYNTYTTGDKSYGKTAAIDHQSLKVAWVKNIPSQSLNFYDKTTIDLKYLVDSSTSLIELSLSNTNLCEVQNTFKSGTPVVLSISDVQKPTNQTTLNGLKTIFRGGYSYDPILYRENNETLTFTHNNIVSSASAHLGVKAYNLDSYLWAAGGDGRTMKVDPNKISNQIGGGTQFGQDGASIYKINSVNAPEGSQISYAKTLASSWDIKQLQSTYTNKDAVTSKYPTYGWDVRGGTDNKYVYSFNVLNFNNTNLNLSAYNTEPDPNSYAIDGGGNYTYKVPRTSNYKLSGSIPFYFSGDDTKTTDGNNNNMSGYIRFKVMGLVQSSRTPDIETSWITVANTFLTPLVLGNQVNYSSNLNAIKYDGNSNSSLFDCSLNSTANLIEGDYIRFQFYLFDNMGFFYDTRNFLFMINSSPDSFSRKPSPAFFEIYDTLTPFTKYNYTSTYSQIPPLFITASANSIVFDPTAQSLINSDAIFTPSSPANNYYSPVVDYFGIQKQDLLRVGQFNNPNPVYYEVLNTYTASGQTYATLDRTIDTGSFNNAQSFAILRPKPNETSVIINYRKQLGDVSQTILIPYDANDTIKNSVGNIFKTLNTNLK